MSINRWMCYCFLSCVIKYSSLLWSRVYIPSYCHFLRMWPNFHRLVDDRLEQCILFTNFLGGSIISSSLIATLSGLNQYVHFLPIAWHDCSSFLYGRNCLPLCSMTLYKPRNILAINTYGICENLEFCLLSEGRRTSKFCRSTQLSTMQLFTIQNSMAFWYPVTGHIPSCNRSIFGKPERLDRQWLRSHLSWGID